jgi:lipoyl(octanoyl) transferase
MRTPAWISELGTVEYGAAASLQRSLRAAREAGDMPDTLLVLEHEPVITVGHRTEPQEIASALASAVPVVATERGGKATYHGPGQIVVYPILDLARHGSDLRAYVRALEQSIIDTLEEVGVVAERRCEYPGVWTAGASAKIASIGVRVTKWISFHGIALNVSCDLTPFTWFTPCGIGDVRMTSVEQELGAVAPGVAEVRGLLVAHLQRQLGLECGTVPAARLVKIAERHPVAEPVLAPVAFGAAPGAAAPAAVEIFPGGVRGGAAT